MGAANESCFANFSAFGHDSNFVQFWVNIKRLDAVARLLPDMSSLDQRVICGRCENPRV